MFLALLFVNETKAQYVPPCVNDTLRYNDTVFTCGQVTLTVTPPAGGDATNSYTMSLIAYNPDSYLGNYVFNINNVGDDNYSDSIPIGFNFCFYGNTYNQVAVSSNGYLSFNIANLLLNGALNGGYSTWELDDPIPNPNGEFIYDANGYPYPPLNSIMGPWEDIDPDVILNGEDSIKYQIFGCYPYRRLVVSYDSLPYYDCNNLFFKGQIVIFESTNVIEIRIQHKDECSSWSSWSPGAAVEGLQNATGTAATVVPGRNYYNVWTADNETYRFIPDNPAPTINWYQGLTLVGTGTSLTVTPTANTVYTSMLIYSCGITVALDTFTIIIGDTLPTMGSTASTCIGNTGSAWAIPNGNSGPYTYTWTPSGQTGQTATNLGSGVYTVTITNASGCSTVDTVTVANTGNLSITGGVVNLPCFGDNLGQAYVTVLTGTSPYTYVWTPSAQAGITATNLSADTYTCSVTDANGCIASITETITQPDSLTLTSYPASPPACVVGGTGSDTAIVIGGTGPYTYLWSPSGGNGQIANNLAAGNYTVNVTDANGCTKSTSSIITNASALSLITSPDTTICQGNSTTLTATIVGGNSPFTVLWAPGGATTTSITVAPLITTAYTITVTDVTNCIVTATITVTVTPGPHVQFTGDSLMGCNPWTAHFIDETTSVDSIVSTEWSFGDGSQLSDSLNPYHTYYTAGTFTVTLTVTTVAGCTVSVVDSNMVTVYPTPIAHFQIKPEMVSIINSQVQFNNNSIGATSFNWNFGDSTGSNLPDPFHTYPDTGVYWVTLVVFNAYGCSDTASGTVIVTPNDAFFVPNAFHPQSNGNNNHFQGYGVGITSFEMDIFDRWSERVFYSTNVNDGWDGTINGQDAPEGVYVYHISVSINNHAAVEYTGSLTLVR